MVLALELPAFQARHLARQPPADKKLPRLLPGSPSTGIRLNVGECLGDDESIEAFAKFSQRKELK
jgi:hypothetical protein